MLLLAACGVGIVGCGGSQKTGSSGSASTEGSTSSTVTTPPKSTGTPVNFVVNGFHYSLAEVGPLARVTTNASGKSAPPGSHYVSFEVLEENKQSDRPAPLVVTSESSTPNAEFETAEVDGSYLAIAGAECFGQAGTGGAHNVEKGCGPAEYVTAGEPASIPPSGKVEMRVYAGPLPDSASLAGARLEIVDLFAANTYSEEIVVPLNGT
jgi:hypothetical protein